MALPIYESLSQIDRTTIYSDNDLIELAQPTINNKYKSRAITIENLFKDINAKIVILEQEIADLDACCGCETQELYPYIPYIMARKTRCEHAYKAALNVWEKGIADFNVTEAKNKHGQNVEIHTSPKPVLYKLK